VFAITFAMGVVTGITMSSSSEPTGRATCRKSATSPAAAAFEVLFAFFLEATFLGVMLYGMNRGARLDPHRSDAAGGDRHHAVGVLDPRAQLVMQTPAGHILDGGKIIAGDCGR